MYSQGTEYWHVCLLIQYPASAHLLFFVCVCDICIRSDSFTFQKFQKR